MPLYRSNATPNYRFWRVAKGHVWGLIGTGVMDGAPGPMLLVRRFSTAT